jgi:hypothetical protein
LDNSGEQNRCSQFSCERSGDDRAR